MVFQFLVYDLGGQKLPRVELERRLLDLLDVLLDLGKELGELFAEFRLDSHEVRLLSTVQILLTEGKPPLPPWRFTRLAHSAFSGFLLLDVLMVRIVSNTIIKFNRVQKKTSLH